MSLIFSSLKDLPQSLAVIITSDHKTYNQLIISMSDKLSNINQWRKDFILEAFVLFLSIRGRINFLQLARYGKHKEQRYRQQFEKQFDFLTFNKELVLSSGSGVKKDRIFDIALNFRIAGQELFTDARTLYPVGGTLLREFPEVEDFLRMRRMYGATTLFSRTW